jgi:hypothetical protein
LLHWEPKIDLEISVSSTLDFFLCQDAETREDQSPKVRIGGEFVQSRFAH